MRFLIDSNVLIDVSRGSRAAIDYVDGLTDSWAISQVTALEPIVGARDKREVATIDGFLAPYPVVPLSGCRNRELVADRDSSGQTERSLGHNEVEPMNLPLEFGMMHVDDASLVDVCRRYNVKELSLFGSVARGETRPESDVDIMVEFEPGARVGLVRFESLAEELEALAGRRVDLVTRRGLKPWVRPAVLKDARVIYAA
jgi:predicted nucleotidyltransferase